MYKQNLQEKMKNYKKVNSNESILYYKPFIIILYFILFMLYYKEQYIY